MNTKRFWFVEITDTFGGEANYSWVTRHKVRANTQRGAVWRVSRDSGMSWHSVGCDRYDSASGATCMFVMPWEDSHGDYLHVKEELAS